MRAAGFQFRLASWVHLPSSCQDDSTTLPLISLLKEDGNTLCQAGTQQRHETTPSALPRICYQWQTWNKKKSLTGNQSGHNRIIWLLLTETASFQVKSRFILSPALLLIPFMICLSLLLIMQITNLIAICLLPLTALLLMILLNGNRPNAEQSAVLLPASSTVV